MEERWRMCGDEAAEGDVICRKEQTECQLTWVKM